MSWLFVNQTKRFISIQYPLVFISEYSKPSDTNFFIIIIALFIVYLSVDCFTLKPAVSSLIVPPNGLIYFRVDYAEKQSDSWTKYADSAGILHFISSNVVCIVKSIPTKENPKRFSTVSSSPPSLAIPLKVKNNGARRCPWDTVDTACRFAASPSMLWGHSVTCSQILRFCASQLFSASPKWEIQKGQGNIVKKDVTRCHRTN